MTGAIGPTAVHRSDAVRRPTWSGVCVGGTGRLELGATCDARSSPRRGLRDPWDSLHQPVIVDPSTDLATTGMQEWLERTAIVGFRSNPVVRRRGPVSANCTGSALQLDRRRDARIHVGILLLLDFTHVLRGACKLYAAIRSVGVTPRPFGPFVDDDVNADEPQRPVCTIR